jgi:hypothetical protein
MRIFLPSKLLEEEDIMGSLTVVSVGGGVAWFGPEMSLTCDGGSILDGRVAGARKKKLGGRRSMGGVRLYRSCLL